MGFTFSRALSTILCMIGMGICSCSSSFTLSTTYWQICFFSSSVNFVNALYALFPTASMTFCTLNASRLPSFLMTLTFFSVLNKSPNSAVFSCISLILYPPFSTLPTIFLSLEIHCKALNIVFISNHLSIYGGNI